MHISLDTVQVATEHVHLVDGQLSAVALVLTNSKDGLEIFSLVQLWDVTRVQDSVDVLEHILVDNLSINKQESSLFGLDTSLHQDEFKIIAPVGHGVALDDLNLEDLERVHVGSQFGQTLTAGTTDTEKESVTLRLSEHTADSGDVLTSVHKHNQFHGEFDSAVVVFEILFDLGKHSRQVSNDFVGAALAIDTFREVTEDDTVGLEDLSLAEFEFLGGLGHEQLEEDFLVLVVDHTVTEYTLVLVHPHANQIKLGQDMLN